MCNGIRSYDIIMKQAIKVIHNKADSSFLITPENPTFSLIWLHGLGDSSAGFLDYFQHRNSPVHRGARIKLLQAPSRRVTINGGAKFNSWYDIKDLRFTGRDEDIFNIEEIKDSLAIVDRNVTEEVEYWKKSGVTGTDEEICGRIFIGGFSQGCAISLLYGLTAKRLLAGVIALSGHVFTSFDFPNAAKIPIVAYHGDEDDVINYRVAKLGYEKYLKQAGNFKFTLVKELYHSVTQEQLSEVTAWISNILKEKKIIE